MMRINKGKSKNLQLFVITCATSSIGHVQRSTRVPPGVTNGAQMLAGEAAELQSSLLVQVNCNYTSHMSSYVQ